MWLLDIVSIIRIGFYRLRPKPRHVDSFSAVLAPPRKFTGTPEAAADNTSSSATNRRKADTAKRRTPDHSVTCVSWDSHSLSVLNLSTFLDHMWYSGSSSSAPSSENPYALNRRMLA